MFSLIETNEVTISFLKMSLIKTSYSSSNFSLAFLRIKFLTFLLLRAGANFKANCFNSFLRNI